MVNQKKTIFAAQIERFNEVNLSRYPDGLKNQRFELKIKSLTSSWRDSGTPAGTIQTH
jgi:hypothetical protein